MLELKNISFGFYDAPILKNLSFGVLDGQNIAIIGESGSGKSTLLKLIYGLYDLDSGSICYNEKPILGPKYNLIPGEDYIKYLAQDFDLMPYITVEENVGKFLSNIYRDQKKARIEELLEMVEMTDFAKVKAKFLSGGQQQRVALAKVLALEPKILLLDEPFSQIDHFRKNNLQRKVYQYLKGKEISCIVATHDNADALAFSDEIIVLKKGEIIAKNNPEKLFKNPESKEIASLFGDVNELEWQNKIHLVYPFQLKKVEKGKWFGTVNKTYFKGSHYLIELENHQQTIFFTHFKDLEIGSQVHLDWTV